MRRRWSFSLIIVLGAIALSAQSVCAGEREISFQTEDGWTIYGTLTTPDENKEKVPVVILLPSGGHDRSAFGIYRFPGQYQYPGMAPVINAKGVATLALDLRGQGKSTGATDLHSLRTAERSKMYLDVRGAIAFLESQPGVDLSRIGIVAETGSADAAVLGWGGNPRVKAIALVSGLLSEAAKGQIAASPKLPLFLVTSTEDKTGFADMTDAYFLSKSKESNIEVYTGVGMGTAMFSAFRYKFPKEKPLQTVIGDWMADQLLRTGLLREVSFQTQDGWTIYGNFRVPQGAAGKLPAVILLHSGLSDRHVYHELEIELAKAGLAVLNIDWRGKGKSTGKGQYFELPKAERDNGFLDALAAVNFLSSQPTIQADRIGVLGTVIGAKYAMAAAAEDPRIKTAVVLTGYIPTEKEKTYFTTHKVPVLYVTSQGHGRVTQALTEMYTVTKGHGSELVVYEGGAIGYQLFKLDEDLMPRLVRWMNEKLNE